MATTDRGIEIHYDIPYRPTGSDPAGERWRGDLFLPQRCHCAPLALVIHGGGWNAMDKNSFAGVAEFLALQGYAAFAINYRLIAHAPYPACLEDCLAAVDFLAAGSNPHLAGLGQGPILICGGSAGGHLALMTGLTARSAISGIISIAGPTDLNIQLRKPNHHTLPFFGEQEMTPELLRLASPIHYVTSSSPPLLCTHSRCDGLVDLDQAKRLVAAYHTAGARAELYAYDGNDLYHGIWPSGYEGPIDGPAGRRTTNLKHLLPELEAAIAAFVRSLA